MNFGGVFGISCYFIGVAIGYWIGRGDDYRQARSRSAGDPPPGRAAAKFEET